MERERGALRVVPSRDALELPPRLPTWFTSFVGREREVADVGRLLGSHRLVSLIGAGGSGKTRLAVAAAERLTEQFPDGVFLVELAPVADGTGVAPAVARSLGVPLTSASVEDAVAHWLADRHALLVLDNCEHVRETVSRLIHTLLTECPAVAVLTTTRERLGVPGEVRWPVPTLSVPSGNEQATAATIGQHDAVRLLQERALLARPDFTITDDNAASVAEICRAVDGLPLAIELVASRLDVLGVGDVLERLRTGRTIPASSDPTVQPRHVDLDALLDWSHDLLEPDARTLLRRLSVFAGPVDLSAVEAVCASDPLPAERVLQLLVVLIDRSLVVADERQGRAHYRMLRTVHRYAVARLAASGEADAVHERHLRWLLDSYAPPHRSLGGYTDEWVSRVVPRMDDLQVAFSWAHLHSPADAVTIGSWLLLVTTIRGGSPTSIRTTLQEALERSADLPPSVDRGIALNVVAWDLERGGLYDDAAAAYAEALVIGRSLGDDLLVADTNWSLGDHELYRLRPQMALAHYELARPCFEALGDPVRRFRVVSGIGQVAAVVGDLDTAEARLEEAHRIAQDAGQAGIVAEGLRLLAAIAHERGDRTRAERLLREALTIAGTTPDLWLSTVCRSDLAEVTDDRAEAARLAAAALGSIVAADLRGCVKRMAVLIAEAALDRGDAAGAARLIGASSQLPDPEFGCGDWGPTTRARSATRRAAVAAAAQRILGDAAFASARATGAADPVDTVMSHARMGLTTAHGGPELAPVAASASLRRDGDGWQVTFADTTVRAPAAKGIAYLARLLVAPDQELHVLDLTASGSPGAGHSSELHLDAGHAGAILDPRARMVYRRRLHDLREELEEADRYGDAERSERAQTEIDALTAQLAEAFGVGGRERRGADVNERARKAVTKCLREAVSKLAQIDPRLGRHLEASLRTGMYCSYRPEQPTTWTVETGSSRAPSARSGGVNSPA